MQHFFPFQIMIDLLELVGNLEQVDNWQVLHNSLLMESG